MDLDDSIDIQVRPARELFGRAALLAALGRRGLIERGIEADPMAAETDRFDLQAWARVELGLWMSPEDLHVLQAPAGSLIDEEVVYCAEALISASTIGWCIGAFGASGRYLPIISDGAPERDTLAWIPAPWTQLRSRLRLIKVRGDEELARERERWELIVWRMALFDETGHKQDEDAALQDVVAELQKGGLIGTASGDFAREDGTPFRELDQDHQDQLDVEATLRLQALNWVCGFGEDWDDVPLFPD